MGTRLVTPVTSVTMRTVPWYHHLRRGEPAGRTVGRRRVSLQTIIQFGANFLYTLNHTIWFSPITLVREHAVALPHAAFTAVDA